MGKKYNPVKQLTTRIDELDDNEKRAVVDYVLGIAEDEARSRRKEIEFGYLPDLYEEIEASYNNWGKIIGLRTGYRVIDMMTMGLAPGELIVVGGATSNGKTLMSMNIASKIAMAGKNVLFVTLEMTKVELGIRFKKIMGNGYEKHAGQIFWQQNDELSWKSIDGLMRKAKEEAEVDIVVIDHLHYFTRELENVAEDLGRITKEFKKNAIRHGLPVILISHTRKGNDSRGTKTGINDLRGSSYIAQDADIVLMVRREEEYPDDIIVTLEKNRNRYGVKVGSEYHLPMNGIEIMDVNPSKRFGK